MAFTSSAPRYAASATGRCCLDLQFQPLVLEDDIAVGHAREVVANCPVQPLAFNARAGLAADFFGVFQKMREERFQQFLKTLH